MGSGVRTSPGPPIFQTANDSVNGNWSYGYDDLNRLISAGKAGLSLTYDYDRFGNRYHQTQAGQGSISLTYNNSNQISNPGYQYDAAGNLLMDNFNCYTYDAESRLSSVAPITPSGSGVCGATAMSYLYDPDGRRVARLQNGSILKQYYYDAAGHMITEADASGNTLRAEIYAGDRHLATWTNSGGGATFFNHADWLGTERARTNSSGTVCETITSLPYGDGEQTSGNCTPTPTFFTGLDRDAESGLDHTLNRQYASNYGRWLTPDPGGVKVVTLADPQTWNMYGYVRDNPLTLTDPTGLDWKWFKDRWQWLTGTTIIPPPPPPPPPPKPKVAMALLKTDIEGHTTTFQTSTPTKGYSEVQIETRTEAAKGSKPGAADPYSTHGISGVSNRHAGEKAYGPEGAFIDTNDPRGRVIHGGGSSLGPHAFDDQQPLTKTLGCTRGHNEDVIKLGNAITSFQKNNPDVVIPYIRE